MSKTHYKIGTYKLRDKEGKFSSFKRKVINAFKFTVKWTTIGGALGTAIYVSFLFGALSRTEYVNADPVDTVGQRVEKMKVDLVDQIAKLENKTNIPGVYDDNKGKSLPAKDKVSYGCLQFKISTIQYYEKNLNQKKISDNDAVSIAIDCAKAKELAKQIIFEVPGGLFNWSVATQKMASEVEFIKLLNK